MAEQPEPQNKSQARMEEEYSYPDKETLDEWEHLARLNGDFSWEQVLRLILALRAEQHDIGMITRCVSEVYDELTCGRISKPNTEPSAVIDQVTEIQDEALKDATADMQRWVDDLQSGMYMNCSYCGHRFARAEPGEEIPETMRESLQKHMEECPEHPMSAMKKDRDRMHNLLKRATDGEFVDLEQLFDAMEESEKE